MKKRQKPEVKSQNENKEKLQVTSHKSQVTRKDLKLDALIMPELCSNTNNGIILL